ncbi:MAG: methylated-DNA--[protein]-cysteine S-methyltransferase [Burkholderiaceae bacterium]|nr:methylated-DNA--[protein]-cysteine S-methyltransferase [Burkholderiaceae bacterium]
MAYEYMWIGSPVGQLKLVARGEALAGVLWEVERANRVTFANLIEDRDSLVLNRAAMQLAEYFAGRRRRFDLPLEFAGTPFQKDVWTALLSIPFGVTKSYGDIARQIGRPNAVRAVGAANGRNPISIIAPCHRVIGSTGGLTGFAGGIETKATLLALEARHADADNGVQKRVALAQARLAF